VSARVLILLLLAAGCGSDLAAADGGADAGVTADGGSSDLATPGDSDAALAGDGGGGTWVHGTFTNDQGSRDWSLYVPSGYQSGTPLPLVTMLHGCTVTADQMDALTQLSQVAEAQNFLAVYPSQSLAANPSGCWNWFLTADQARGMGEPSLIAGIVDHVVAGWSVDAKRVFVIGASAGGAMSVIMGATYPDRFAAIGVVAGCEYGGAPCGPSGGPDPVAQGKAAYQAMGSFGHTMPVIVFHGDQDPVAAPINGQQVIQQWLATDDWADDGAANGSIPTTAASTVTAMVPGGRSYDLGRFLDGAGALLIESYVVHGAGHAWPGGPAGQPFTDPTGPDATGLSWAFFVAHPR
jgi:poly(hydroxyalkanoate) depolymerase family esterase